MLWCYRTFAKQQNATLLLQRLNCCHLARSGLKVLKAQAKDLYNVWAAGKDDSSLLKNQIEKDKAFESSSSIIEVLHKNIKDNEDELEQVKKTHVKLSMSLRRRTRLLVNWNCRFVSCKNALEKAVEMSKNTYESELSSLKSDLE